MTVLRGDYAGFKFVPSRGVVQVIIELPMEAGEAAFALLGVPNKGAQVAIARLVEEAAEIELNPGSSSGRTPAFEAVNGGSIPSPGATLTLSQLAFLFCRREAFWKFLEERTPYAVGTEEEAATALRALCGVESRSAIVEGAPAGNIFKEIKLDFEVWLDHVE